MKVVAILESMWDWQGRTSAAGYSEAARFFHINPANYSGKRLYKLVGPNAQLLVTNACRELVSSASQHGMPNPAWLAENLALIESNQTDPDADPISSESSAIDVLLVCGKVAQRTYAECGYVSKTARVIQIPHPAARQVWTQEFIAKTARDIQQSD